jgi:TonB family protein
VLIDAVIAGPADATGAARIAREVLTRQASGKPGLDLAPLFAPLIETHWSDLIAVARTSPLSDAERAALRKLLGEEFPRREKSSKAPEPTGPAIRTIPALWPGFLESLLAAAACVPKNDASSTGAIMVDYRVNGTPEKLSLIETNLSPECQRVLTTMARLTLADSTPSRERRRELLLLPLNADSIACVGTPVDTGQTRVRGRITPPKKIRDVKPIYPAGAQQKRVQGTVVLEAMISETGCVSHAKVIRGIDGLNFAALQAVLRWRFAPTLVGARPTPVMMTVTVNFSLE